MESFKKILDKMPDTLVADAGYGYEENYEYLENNDVDAFVKYQYFNKKQSKKWIQTELRIYPMIAHYLSKTVTRNYKKVLAFNRKNNTF
jgi:hypothetical protein